MSDLTHVDPVARDAELDAIADASTRNLTCTIHGVLVRDVHAEGNELKGWLLRWRAAHRRGGAVSAPCDGKLTVVEDAASVDALAEWAPPAQFAMPYPAPSGFSIEDWHYLLSPCCTASLMDEDGPNLVCGDCGAETEFTTASTTPEAHAARLAATMQA